MPTLSSLIQTQTQQAEPEQDTTTHVSDPSMDQPTENPIDTNGDGVISAEELFAHFDIDGDGKIDMVDYTAHILYHICNPEILRPYFTEAYKKLDMYNESCAQLSGKLKETVMISKGDPTATEKTRKALETGEDVKVIDKDKINQLKISETDRSQQLAGIKK